MLRPRLSHPAWVTLAVITCLLAALAYFPWPQIQANPSVQILPGTGQSLVHLKAPQVLSPAYSGSQAAISAIGAGTPTAMAIADFDEDGAMDLATGFRVAGGGAVSVLRGNPDALAPKDTSLYAKAMAGKVPPTFLSKAAVFALPVSPDFMATGDFDRDGHKDVLVAARGGALYFMKGDGHGRLAEPQLVELVGGVTALASIADGHVAVGTESAGGPQVAILAPGPDGLSATGTFPLTAPAVSMAWGALGQRTAPDLAIASGDNVVIIYHAFHADAQTETVNVPFTIHALNVGDYIWNRNGLHEIALLADDGSIHIMQHGPLNTTPVSTAGAKANGSLRSPAAVRARAQQASSGTAPGPWTLATKLSASVASTSGAGHSMLQSPRLTGAADLLVVDASNNVLKIVDGTGKAATSETAISFSSLPVAAAVMPQKLNGKRDLVVMTAGQTTPTIISEDSSGIDPAVTTTADEDDAGACTSSSVTSGTGPDNQLSLREALCEATNIYQGGSTGVVTVSVPAGTYTLTSLETGELQVGVNGCNIALVGAGAASTIIQQGDGVDRVFDIDPNASGNATMSISNVTIQNGTNKGAAATNPAFGGGGMIDGSGSTSPDNLTLTNVVLNNNTNDGTAASFGGGGLAMEGVGSLSITNSTISNNTAIEESGAGVEEGNNNVNAGDTFTFTNDIFTGNESTAIPSPPIGGQGGGLDLSIPEGNSAGISGSTFTNNTAQDASVADPGEGGAIYNDGPATGSFSISNSRIAGNHAGDGSGLVTGDTTANVIDNWWGCNGGPGASGCDTVVNLATGSVTFNPWLVLSISANPAEILPSATSTLTADLTHNSNGIGGFSVPNGTPISFGGTLGTISGASSTLTNGQGTATYTAGSTAGNDTAVSATVDSQTSDTTINILDTVSFNTNPAGVSYSVDGITYTTPQTFNWIVGSSHSVSTTSPQATGSAGSQYAFNNWSDGGAISHSITAPSATTTYTATFNLQYQLTTNVSPAGSGSVTPSSGQYFNAGSAVPITATPNAGFVFNNWTSSPDSVASSTSASTTITMNAPETVTANFYVQVTVGTSPSGLSFTVDGTTYTSTQTLSWSVGSQHSISTTSPQAGTPGTQYVFGSWSDGGAISHSVNAPSTATTYTASFNTQYQLTTAANPTNGGTVSPTSGGFYNSGSVVTLTATANANYTFSSWTGNVANANSASTSITMTSPQSVTANFTLNTVQITVGTSPTGLSFTVDGTTYTSTQTFSWSVGSQHSISTTSPQAGTPGTQYAFTSWSDGGAISHTVNAPSTATTYTASFNTQYQLTTAANPANGGTVSPVSGGFYNSGSVVPLTATSNAGFSFSNWTGNVANANSASTTITMTSPQSVTANFVQSAVQITVGTNPTGLSFSVDGTNYTSTQMFSWTIGSMHTIATTSPQFATQTRYLFSSWSDGGAISHTVTAPSSSTTYTASFTTQYRLTTNVFPSGGGTVTPPSGFFNAGSVVPLTATANAGFSFNKWTGNVANPASASTTITMNAPELVTADFVQPQVKVNPTSINFGTVFLSSMRKQNVTVTNTGHALLDISDVSITPGGGTDANAFTFVNNCPSQLDPGKSCVIAIDFSADATGDLSATLSITDNAAGSPQQVSLSAMVINPKGSFNPTTLAFGSTKDNTTKTQQTVFTNTGTTTLFINNITITGDPTDYSETNNCPSSLQPKDFCTISVTFDPKSVGSLQGNLVVTDNSQVGMQKVFLTGTGTK